MDIDLEKFFDNVPHDRLLRLVSDVVKDGNVVSLVNKFLKAGVMVNCRKGYMFVSHSKILQNAITKEGLQNPIKS